MRFVVRRQNADGGFPLVPGGESNAQSTAWAIQGLLAAGRDPAKVRRSRDPLAYLRSLTAPSGEVRYSRTSRQTPVWVTAQAVMALARKPLPLARVPRARRTTAPRPAPTATPAPRERPHTTKPAQAARTTPRAPAGKAPAATARATTSPTLATPSLATSALAAAVVPDRARAAGYAAGLALAALP